jgi:precorrin-3B synthase
MSRCVPSRETDGDRCPGTLALHEAGDGLLARIRLPGGRLARGQLTALADAAALGNGLVDITSRANVQVRGIGPGARDALAAILGDAGLVPSPAHDRARNILASPLAGRHPDSRAEVDSIVEELDRLVCAQPALAGLPGRFLFAVDDGSRMALSPAADVGALAEGADAFRLILAAQPTTGRLSRAAVAAGLVGAALAFLDARRSLGSRAWRIAELTDGAALVAARIGAELERRSQAASVRVRCGRVRQRDGSWSVTALAPLGMVDAAQLRLLADLAGDVRLSPMRTVTLLDLTGATRAADRLARAGLESAPGSGWVGLSACAGAGRCARARLDVRAAALRRVAARPAGSGAERWAACERRCGETGDETVTVAPDGGELLVRRRGDSFRVADVEAALEALA